MSKTFKNTKRISRTTSLRGGNVGVGNNVAVPTRQSSESEVPARSVGLFINKACDCVAHFLSTGLPRFAAAAAGVMPTLARNDVSVSNRVV